MYLNCNSIISVLVHFLEYVLVKCLPPCASNNVKKHCLTHNFVTVQRTVGRLGFYIKQQ